MIKIKHLFSCTLLLTFLMMINSCSLEKKIVGTWQIKSYSENTEDGSSANAVNIGTINFNKDGMGTNDLEYKILGSERSEESNFTYKVNDETVTIRTEEDDSELAKSWIVVESRRKFQKWKSTDGEGSVQTLILEKE